MSTGELKADINQTLEAFEHVLLLYKSGLHLDNLPPSIIGGKSLKNEDFFFRNYSEPSCRRFFFFFSCSKCFTF